MKNQYRWFKDVLKHLNVRIDKGIKNMNKTYAYATEDWTRYWTSRVNKLTLGKSVKIPAYGTVTCYKAANGIRGARRFKLTNIDYRCQVRPSGNLKLGIIARDIDNRMI